MEREKIIQKVKHKLDEVSPLEEGNPVGSPIIEKFLDSSVTDLYSILPAHLIKSTDISEQTISGNTDGSGTIEMPDGFIKLVNLKLTDWNRPVSKTITEEDPKYKLQFNAYTRGGKSKPVVVQRYDEANSKFILEYFTSATHEIDRGSCLVDTKAESVQDNLVEALTWMIAANVLQSKEKIKESEEARKRILDFYK